jgi:hypothetical protein
MSGTMTTTSRGDKGWAAGVEPLQQLVVQHFEFAHRAVRHFERDRSVLGQRLGWGATAGRLQVADAPLQLRQQARAVFAGHIVKKVQARPLRDLLGRLQVVKGVELANEVAPLPPPSGQERGRVQVHLRQRQSRPTPRPGRRDVAARPAAIRARR